ncbi:hypothetical protein OG298_22395 [Streptomyces sp. NBC_01005]|uniref:hypothetical protein n=1 Tax=unclassified Streptomyces TaxID=2593676 RepID=UPI0038631156|nr:hypothetical protein OG298_22395 [Streptomyces sp. NBC_01005]WTC96407.1 hypothetical protein OH736_22410 [Streptomyces sp. NBC_01650]
MNSEIESVRQSGPQTGLDAGTWATAVDMYRNRYSFIAVGPRVHEEWLPDVAAVMQRKVADPRGWRGRDPERGDEELEEELAEELAEDPAFPFRVPPTSETGAAQWRSRLFEIPRSAVVRLLVMLATDAMDVSRQHGFADRRPGMEEHAQVILSRFPEGSRFLTNTRHGGDHPDFYERVTGCWPMTRYAWDFGLVVVSRAEVALIWSFDAS